MHSKAKTVEDCLRMLPETQRTEVEKVLSLVRMHLPPGYVETMNWGMITWEVPMALSGPTYNGQPLMYAALASQKRHLSLYLCGVNCVTGLRETLARDVEAAGKTFDMGAACLRFRRFEDLPNAAVGAAIAAVPMEEFIAVSRR
jgi:Domain of unknown function (DU1801)